MSSRDARLLSAGHSDRVEPLVTYRRLPPDDARAPSGRIEPHFTAVRVDRRDRVHGAEGDGIETLPLVEAPPSDGSIDHAAGMTSGEIRQVLRPRGPRYAAIAGVFAILVGAGVLAATYGGVVELDASPEPSALVSASGEESQVAVLESEATDGSGRAVRVVADYPISVASETAALAPSAAADPVAGGAALSDQATVSGEAALLAEPPGRMIVDAPLPRLRPATASYHPPQPPPAAIVPESGVATTLIGTAPATLAAPAPAPVAPAPAPVAGTAADVESALANVDRILDQERAVAATTGSGDAEFYGPVAPIVPGSPGAEQVPVVSTVQPLPYPPLAPLAGAAPAYPADASAPPLAAAPQYPAAQVYPAPAYPPAGVVLHNEPYGPFYPGVPLLAGPSIGQPETIADARQPWWLPQRRATVVDAAPVPPADIPAGTGGVW